MTVSINSHRLLLLHIFKRALVNIFSSCITLSSLLVSKYTFLQRGSCTTTSILKLSISTFILIHYRGEEWRPWLCFLCSRVCGCCRLRWRLPLASIPFLPPSSSSHCGGSCSARTSSDSTRTSLTAMTLGTICRSLT
jgi:hypothetical protein